MLALIALMYVTVEPETQYSVDEIMESPDEFVGSEIHLRGIVKTGSLDNSSHSFHTTRFTK